MFHVYDGQGIVMVTPSYCKILVERTTPMIFKKDKLHFTLHMYMYV